MPYHETGPLNMPAYFERQRRVIFSATLALWAMGSLATYFDRNNFEGWKPNDWIGAELAALPLGICAVLAGWAKPLAAMGRRRRTTRSECAVLCFLYPRFLTASREQS